MPPRLCSALLASSLLVGLMAGVPEVAQADTCAVPGAPTAVTATVPSSNKVNVTWSAAPDNGTPLQGYVAQAVVGTALGPAMAVVGTTASITGVAAGSVTVRVRAVSSCGNGAIATSAAVTATGAASTYASTVLAGAPIGYYRLGEAAETAIGADSSSAAKPLTYNYNGDRSQSGALQSDNDRASTVNASQALGTSTSSLPNGDDARTVEAWVKPNDGYERWIAGWGRNEPQSAFNVGLNQVSILVDTYVDTLRFSIPKPLDDEAWHHIVVTARTDQVTVYLDGVLLARKTLPNPMNTANDSGLVVGAAHNGGPFYGGLDEIALYNKELTAAEVTAHFAASGWSRPSAPTRPGIVDGADNEVVVNWSPPTSAGRPAATSYTVTALTADTGTAISSVVVAGTKTAARITGIPANRALKATIVPNNIYGPGVGVATTTTATAGGVASPYAWQVRSLGPLAYYRLNEASGVKLGGDSSGRGKTLNYGRRTAGLQGALSTDTDEASSGDGTCCMANSFAAMPEGNSQRTVEAWIKPDDTRAEYVAGWGMNEGGRSFNVGIRGQDVFVSDSSRETNFSGNKVLADGAWHYLVVVYDGNRLTAFIDGVSLGSKTVSDGYSTLDRSGLQIGSGIAGYSPWDGGLDEVAVYGGAMASATVQAHFAASGHGVPVLSGTVGVTAGANKITATWPAPTGGDDASRFTVTALKAGASINSVVVAPDATSAVISNLPGATAYTVRVTATNSYGTSAALTSAAVTPTGSATTYSGSVLGNGPIAYYRFEEAAGSRMAADSSPNNQPLTVNGRDVGGAGALGPDDKGGDLDGGSNFASAPVSRLPLNDDPRTIEAWIKPRDGYGRWLAGWGNDGMGNSFNVGVEDSVLLVSAGSDDLRFPVGRSLVDGVWHHVAFSAGGSSVSAFVDGALVGTRSFAGTMDTGGSKVFRVGSYFNTGGGWYGGLDEVSLYASAANSLQIAAHFSASGHAKPGGVTGVGAVSRVNGLAVSWAAPPATPDALKEYVVTAYKGTTAVNSKSVPGNTTSTLLSGLQGATAYTVKVTAVNPYGSGPAGTSPSATPTGPASTYASTVLANAPSAYYRLGEAAGTVTVADSSGKGKPLSLNRAQLEKPGAITGDTDTGAAADGGCCIASGIVSLPKGNGSRSVEAWVKPSDEYERWLLGWGDNTQNRAFALGLRDSTVLVDTYGDGAAFATSRHLNDGAWHHVAATYNATTGDVIAYLDGVSLGTKTFSEPNLTTGANSVLQLGAHTTTGGPFYGDLDDVAIYPSVLSPADVKAHLTAAGHAAAPAVTGVTVASRANGAAVSWVAPAASADPVKYYTVTALKAGVAQNSMVVGAAATTAAFTGLAGATAYTIRVVATNSYGDGPAAVSAAVTPTGTSSTYASEVLADAPAAYYRLSESAGLNASADSSGKAGQIAVTGGTFGTPGALRSDTDRAVTTPGQVVGTARVNDLPTSNSKRTLEAWVQPADFGERWAVGYGATTTNRAFAIGTRNDAVLADISGTTFAFQAVHTLSDGAWHHIAATYDGATIVVYLDGAVLGSKAPSAPLDTLSTDKRLWIGSWTSGYAPYNGGLDEVAVYPNALTAARLQAHFAASAHAVPGATPSVVASAGVNRANVTWGTAPGAEAATGYTVTAFKGTVATNSMTVGGSVRTAVLSGLQGAVAYTIQVKATNSYGAGAAGSSAAITPTGTATTYASQVQALAPTAYYRLGESSGAPLLADSSGKAHPLGYGTGTLGVTGGLSTDPDKSATADGSCCLGQGYVTGLPKSNTARTVEYWTKPTDGNLRWAVGWGESVSNKAFIVGSGDSTINVATWADDLSFPIGHSIANGAWHHVVVTYDGTTARAYVDGVSLGAQTFVNTLRTSTSTTRLVLGAAHDGSTPAYGGLDDIAVYGSVMTAAQVSAHYTSGH